MACAHPEYAVVASREGGWYRSFKSQGVPPQLEYPTFLTVEMHQCNQCGWRRTFAKAADQMDNEAGPWTPPDN